MQSGLRRSFATVQDPPVRTNGGLKEDANSRRHRTKVIILTGDSWIITTVKAQMEPDEQILRDKNTLDRNSPLSAPIRTPTSARSAGAGLGTKKHDGLSGMNGCWTRHDRESQGAIRQSCTSGETCHLQQPPKPKNVSGHSVSPMQFR
ncbi:hypothetical protein BD410DRAFT_447217 [Rickenella mellea]|uniref:Uncharacterized protein n=1 Tax=Rickenella mellea TaxID=50990 RepID=A0A4Y7PUT1_9AGAM|nr:hypothetical protein BD410DRAFT_447217 [Rickenella mellea]